MTPVLNRGRFISLEGGEGAGKSTQARLLAEALRARGIEVLLTREPGGTPGAEAIRALLLHPPQDMAKDGGSEGWGARAEALLFAAARADHIERAILPALSAGQWVVCDRFVDSSRAYQGEAGALGDDGVMTLHKIGSGGLLPDVTLVFDVSEATVAERLARRDGTDADAIGGRGADYHGAVASAFSALAEREPGRLARIDGNGDPDAVHARVMQAIEALL